ncbi:MAG: class I SAM-dependent methyltransferase [Pyrinomonadaceae bacterium]
MKNSIRECPGCSGVIADFVGEKNGFRIFRCSACGTLFTSHLPAAGGEEDYDAYYTPSNLTVPPFILTRIREIFGGFERYRQLDRILDIGFGAGTMLQVGRELGWETFGIEVSGPAVEQARKEGFAVFHGDLLNAGYATDYFDVVTASEIIEHLPDPAEALREISRILRPGGLFWATSPSARSLSYRAMGTHWTVISPPEHLQLYSAQAVKHLLLKSGFSKVSVNTSGLNPVEILHHFRSGSKTEPSSPSFDRVRSAYDINEALTRSRFRTAIKGGANRVLRFLGLGDSLKIKAIK